MFLDNVRVLFIGMLGVGKSLIINIFFGRDECNFGYILKIGGMICVF